MKSSIIVVCATVMMSMSLDAGKNRHHRSVDLGNYLSGDYVDANGQTILHQIAQNCGNDKFTVKMRLFDFLENKLPVDAEKLNQKGQRFQVMLQAAPELAGLVMLTEMIEFVELKDNNGETALDLAKKQNALSGHKRCNTCVELLETFELLKKELYKESVAQ